MVMGRLQAEYCAEMAAVDRELSVNLRHELPLLNEVAGWLQETRGKRLRPLMTLMVARCFTSETPDVLVRAATALELVHTATLIHDDVVDCSSLRRGRPTVNARWGNDVAVLVADWLYSNVFAMAVETLERPQLMLVAGATAHMCESELLQIERRGAMLSLEDYNYVAERKTAALFACCTTLGAQLGGADDLVGAAMGNFGRAFGLLFQAADDLLDFAPNTQTGKPQYADLINRKQSLPVVLAYQAADDAARAAFITAWRDATTPVDVLEDFVQTHGGPDAARAYANRLADEACEQLLAAAPPCAAREHLLEVTRFALNRRS